MPLPATETTTDLRRATNWPRWALRFCAVAVASVGVLLWPRKDAGYGLAFWLWGAGIIGYSLSFQPGRTRFGPSRRIVWAGLFTILALAAALRFVALGEIPVYLHDDEIFTALEALYIARGIKPNVFSSLGWFDTPNLAFAFGAVAMKAIGREGLLAVRLSSAILGMGGIFCVFLLARRWFGDRVALMASFFMTVSYWHIHESRTAFPFVESSFCTALVLYLLVRGLQDRSRLILAVAGVCTGLSLQCYFPARILLLLCPMCWVEEWVRNRLPLRTVLADGAAFCTGGVLVS